MTSSVAIFRKRLLSYSETFIADQGQLLPSYRPIYCGYERDNSGIELIKASKKVLLQEHSKSMSLSKLFMRLKLGGGKAWLSAISSHSPSVIHAHFYNDGVDALLMSEKLNIPVITTVHGHDITKHQNVALGLKDQNHFFNRVDRIIAVSNFIAEQALKKGCPESKLIKHSIGIDLDKFTQEKQESEQPSLLFVGRLVEKKGCTYLLQAMQKLSHKFPELSLCIVGEGKLKSALQLEAKERSLKVEFVGTEDAQQIRQRLASCWLFTAPSITADSGDAEGLGMVFLEAQALRTPVVSFRSGGVVEAIEENQTGLLCDEKDVASLADNISTLLDDANLRKTLGIQGRKRVEALFDVRKQCAKLETIYDEVR